MSSTQEEMSPSTPELPRRDGLAALIARQAIVDEHRAVFGYELFDRTTALDAHTAASDAALLFNALSYGGAGRWWARSWCSSTAPTRAWPAATGADSPRQGGAGSPRCRTGHPEHPEACVPSSEACASAVRLAFNQNVLRKRMPAGCRWPSSSWTCRPKPELAAPGDLPAPTARPNWWPKRWKRPSSSSMADLGVKLFQGFWFAQPSLVQTKTIRPSQAIIIQLINLVRKQASTAEIEDLLKKDPTLSFNLLRFINSSGFGVVRDHLLQTCGDDPGPQKLFRWAALLLTTSRNSGSAPAMGTGGGARAPDGAAGDRTAAPEECDNAFVVGVFSLLDAMLGIPLDKALESVALPQP
jgi:EAL and modified HD-GYP domain-containing signal transduction protein